MMALSTIRQMSADAARDAAEAGLEPMEMYPDDFNHTPFPIPYLGSMDYAAMGYNSVAEFFVDSSGMGAPGEPALTAREFVEKAKALTAKYAHNLWWAITEVGQFQVYVTAFDREDA